MFRILGRFVRRTWPFLLAAWGLLLLITWLTAPSWSKIAQGQEFSFLPENVPSRVAERVYAQAFPTEKSGSNIVVVLHRTDDNAAAFDQDLHFIEQDLAPGIRQIAEAEGGLAYEIQPSDEPLFADEAQPPKPKSKRSIIAQILMPSVPGSGALLVSADRKALLVVVELTPEFASRLNWPVIDMIEGLVGHFQQEGKVPAGLDISFTGSAVIGRDNAMAELRSVRATGILTVVLVAGLLILIYRAPLLAVIPLVTVFLAVQVSINLLGLLSRAGYVTIFDSLQIYITILAYGAGVDYCLFLTARYKEELDRGAEPKDAVSRAIGGVGAALAASAATVMFGIAMMMFAQFGKFREAGFAIPLSLFLVLAATLTFSPALLCLAGRWAFWPQRLRLTTGAGRESTAAAPGWFARGGTLERVWEKVGELLLRRAGAVWLLTVAVMAPFAVAAVFLYNHLSYDLIGDLPADAAGTKGAHVLQQAFPAGIIGPLTVVVVDPHLNFRTDKGRAVVAALTDRLSTHRQELGLADVRSLTAPLGITAAANNDFSGLDVPLEERRQAVERAARQHYVADVGEQSNDATRMDLVLDRSPFSHESIDNLGRIEQAVRDALPEVVRADAQLHFVGTTASIRDLAIVVKHDRRLIEVLVLAAVFVILALLLRGFVVPLYLLLSVLFSYLTTMGVTFAVFYLADPHGFNGIDWRVAIFLFTILIAVGEDYNILLMTRVYEEQERVGPVRGVTEALDRTGPIISSCGIIMAGTFGSLLLAGSLSEMKQLGFALAFGVLLDTFIVRPILVPAFLILLHTGRLSLTGGRKETAAPADTTPQPTRAP